MNASDECFLFLESGGQRWPCSSGDVIGRAGTIALEVLRNVETLSRRHLQIDKRGAAWYVTAMPDTRNVTWMEGQSMQRGVAYPLLGVRTFQVDQFQFFLATANGMMTQAWSQPHHATPIESPSLVVPDPASAPASTAAPTPETGSSAAWHETTAFGATPPLGCPIEGLPGAVIETDPRLHIRHANAGANALLGGDCVGRDFDEWADERIRVRDFLMNLREGDSGGPFVARFSLPAGPREIELHASAQAAGLVVLLRNASEERSREGALAATGDRLARHTRALAEFSLSAAFQEGDLAKSLSLLTVRGAELLDCRRVSVWLKPAEGQGSGGNDSAATAGRVVCQTVHDRTVSAPAGATIDLAYCPMFFDEVATQAWSVASAGSPVMDVLREIGFAALKSATVLGVACRQGGTLHGVMSFERESGGRDDWSEADRHFALCLASFCTAALQARERLDAFARLRTSEKHMAAELAEAERYVRRILPEPVESGHITTEWQITPSEQVGGDSFGYHWINENLFALYILDVVGHGTGAALLSISVLNTVRARLPIGESALGSPARVLSELNEAFPMEQQNGMTFTMWYGVYDRRARTLVYSSGGHPPAVLLLGEVPEGCADYATVATEGPVLGGISGVEFTEECISVPRDSKLFLCTDGAFEIPLGADREWSFEEFIATVRSTRWMDGGETNYLHKRISALCSAPSFPDDFCVVRFSFIL